MSSDVLLKEINENLTQVSAGIKKMMSADGGDIDSSIIAEQVKINTLKRQHELVLKLNSEFPSRIDQITKDIGALKNVQAELLKSRKHQTEQITQLKQQEESLSKQAMELVHRIQEQREFEQLSLFQRDTLWRLISEAIDLRKKIASQRLAQGPLSTQDLNDYEFLSSKIEQNDILLKQTEQSLNLVIESISNRA